MDVNILSAENYGVPEKRRRTIFIGSRINNTITFPQITHAQNLRKKPKTVGDAFFNLKTKNNLLHNHDLESTKIKSDIDLKRIKRIPEGGGIRYEKDEKSYLTKSLKLGIDWKTIPENRLRQTKYQRLDRSSPSPTIMTHRHNYYHPSENRFLTPREAASIQSFPNDFVFFGTVTSQWRQIGNAVPPLLGKAIGSAILEMKKSTKRKISINAPKEVMKNITEKRGRAFNYSQK